MKRWYGLVILTLLIGIILMACTSPSSPTSPAITTQPAASASTAAVSSVAAKPKSGGVFRQIETASPLNIGDPAIVPGIPTYYGPAGESLFTPTRTAIPYRVWLLPGISALITNMSPFI